MNGKIPKGCYASDEWSATYTDDDGRVVTLDCTQYTRASDGEIVGIFTVTTVDGDYIGSEFSAWED